MSIDVEEMSAKLRDDSVVEFNLNSIVVNNPSEALAANEDLADQVAKIVADFNKKMMETFSGLILNFFREHPSLQQISWNQYTPYFNDGDECVFSVNADALTINGLNSEYETWDHLDEKFRYRTVSNFMIDDEELPEDVVSLLRPDYVWPVPMKKSEWSDWRYPDVDKFLPQGEGAELEEVATALYKMFMSMDDDILKAIYGNHIYVYYERDPENADVVYCYTEYFDHD